MARATGAFFVAFIGITYLFGEFQSGGGWYLVLALLVSGAVAAAVSWWLRPESERSEPGVFDERATRRAVRRGVLRTALVAVVWVGLGLTALEIASAAWQTRGDRDSHFADVAGYGFFVSHPGFRLENGRPSCCTRDLRSIGVNIQAAPRTANPLAPPLDETLELNLQNRLVGGPLATSRLPTTGVDVAGSTTTARLARLPDSVVATAVVAFARPLPIADLYRVLGRHGLVGEYAAPDIAIYLQPADTRPGPGDLAARVSWPSPNIAQFQAWVKKLRSSDDGVLEDLRIPPVAALRAIAETPRVYGCVVDHSTPAQLRGFMRDPAVRAVEVGDIAFDIGRPSA